MFFHTNTIAENYLEHLDFSLHTVCLSQQDQDRLLPRSYSSYI